MPKREEDTFPLGDLTDQQVRYLIGETVTVTVYDSPDDTEPTVLAGTVSVIARTSEAVLISFKNSGGTPQPVPASSPITITTDSFLGDVLKDLV